MALKEVQIDYAHSQVTFTVRHMVVAKVHGRFDSWKGKLQLDLDDLTKSSVDVELEANSINTLVPDRDAHLRSADFLDAANHPQLTFKSKRVEKAGDKLHVVGDLTIRGITHEVVLDAEFLGQQKDPWGQQRVAFSAHTAIERGKWELKWNKALEAGGVLVSERVDIHLEIQATL